MIGRTLDYISHHAIAILALVCSLLALAGASYAATQLPKNSVGSAQLKSGAVDAEQTERQEVRRLHSPVREGQRRRQDYLRVADGQSDPVGDRSSYSAPLARSAGPPGGLRISTARLWLPRGGFAPGADRGHGRPASRQHWYVCQLQYWAAQIAA